MFTSKQLLRAALVVAAIGLLSHPAFGENIDPNDDGSKYAYGENVGWVNFEPNVAGPNVGATVSDSNITGFVWAENIGWINLDPNDADPNTGIANDGAGNLSGYAWGENVGWINFDPNVPSDSNNYGVTIDEYGNFGGYAWGENIGWLNFNSAGLFGYGTKVCKVNFRIFARFADDWLDSPCSAGNNWCGGADLDYLGNVDSLDLGLFANEWLGYCPGDWLL